MLSIFAAAFLLSWFLTPAVGWISHRLGVLDHPNERKVHKSPTPKAGGLSIVVGMCGMLAIWTVWSGASPRWLEFAGLSVIVAVIGWIDDRLELSPKIKLLGLLGPVVVWAGSTAIWDTLSWFQAVIDVAFLLFVMNSVNLLDGLDGLAAGYAAIAGLCLALLGAYQGNAGLTVASLALSGGAAGFLPHNFKPAWIFMGDTGSLTLGFALGVLSLESIGGGVLSWKLPVALAVLALPLYDTTVAILRRLRHGRPIFAPDKSHTYNLLVERGGSVVGTVLISYVSTAGFGLAGWLYDITPSAVLRTTLLSAGVAFLASATILLDFLQLRQPRAR